MVAGTNAAVNVTVGQLTSSIGAVVGGVDLRKSLPDDTTALIRQALLDHGVIFFRDQSLDSNQFWAFLEHFGTPHSEEAKGSDDDTPDMVQSADLAPSRHATAVWHADTTSLAKPPMATALRAIEVPPFGGDTCWSSMQAAFEALSEPMRTMLDGLTSIHSVQPTLDRMGEYAQYYEPVYSSLHAAEQVHPVVLTHPETGRKALYVNESFTTRILELSPLENAAVLSVLFRHVEKPDFTMRWKWSVGDVAFWDNRSVQHYAVPDYERTRVMERIVLAGVRPGEASTVPPKTKRQAASAT